MKTIQIIISSFIALSFVSCDIIKEPFTEGNQNPVDTTTVVTPTDEALSGINDEPNYRRVLLEDYTGHQCGNCPRAAETAKSLHDTYGEKLVTMAVHVGFFARINTSQTATKYTFDFRTDNGNELDQFFGNATAGLPNGLVNRTKINNSYILAKETWGTYVDQFSKETAKVKLKIKNELSNDSVLKSTVYIKTISALQGDYKIAMYITEDSLENWQKDYNLPSGQQDIQNYIHRHAFRGVMNSTWGDVLFTNTTDANFFTTKIYTKTLKSNWVKKHCAVITIVYDAVTLEVIQVVEKKITE